MNKEEARRTLLRAIDASTARRVELLGEAARLELEVGAAFNLLSDRFGQTLSMVADLTGLDAAYISTVANQARLERFEIDDPSPIIHHVSIEGLPDYLTARGYALDRIICSDCSTHLVIECGLHPSSFRPYVQRRAVSVGPQLDVPLMIARISGKNRWLAIDDVSIGYRGPHPSRIRKLLVDCGVPADAASKIAFNRHTDFRANDSAVVKKDSSIARLSPISLGPSLIAYTELSTMTDDDWYGTPCLERWIDMFLDPNCPRWARGTTSALLYPDILKAVQDGYPLNRYQRSNALLVIERGDFQLWVTVPRPGKHEWLPNSLYRILKLVDAFPEQLYAEDRRLATSRRLHHWVRGEKPPFFDLLPGQHPRRV